MKFVQEATLVDSAIMPATLKLAMLVLTILPLSGFGSSDNPEPWYSTGESRNQKYGLCQNVTHNLSQSDRAPLARADREAFFSVRNELLAALPIHPKATKLSAFSFGFGCRSFVNTCRRARF